MGGVKQKGVQSGVSQKKLPVGGGKGGPKQEKQNTAVVTKSGDTQK